VKNYLVVINSETYTINIWEYLSRIRITQFHLFKFLFVDVCTISKFKNYNGII